MSFAELLGLSNAFGMDKKIDTQTGDTQTVAEKRAALPPPPAAGMVTFTPEQLAMLARMGSAPNDAHMRAPGAVPPRAPQVPSMTQVALPNVQPMIRPGLGQLIYGGGR